CLSALGIGPGDEVIVPAYTYIATAAAVVAVGAVPVIAEIDESLGLDPNDVEKKITPYTKAVILVHMQGVPGRIEALRAVAKKHGIKMIEDCCQAIGSRYKGEYTGVHSDAFAWSLNYYKIITAGEGGVFFTNDDVAFLRGVYESDPGSPMWDSGLIQERLVPPFSRSGFRANEISAAIARVQLTKMEKVLGHTRAMKKRLLAQLNTPIHYQLQHVDDPEGDCGMSAAILVESADAARRFTEKLRDEGLNIGSVYNTGFPDRHIYTYWDSILNKTGASPAGYPWKDPAYKGNVQYSKDMCPRTLDILSRCLRQSIDMATTEQNIDEIALAINRVDAEL
nr:aminotransferase class V-fold PLP-dependent enzyme [bacterium]